MLTNFPKLFLGCLLALSPLVARGQATLPDPTDPLAGMGVNIHFTDPKPGELEMLSQAGFHWIRMDFVWQSTETAKGVYDFAQYDRLLAGLDKFHIDALFILDYSNPLYCGNDSPRTADQRAAYARWAVAAVTHFHGRGVIWEIWNEPNWFLFWHPKPNADEYAQLAITAAQAIKTAFPYELVVGPANAGVKLDFVEALVKASAKAGMLRGWSGITIHPYRRTGPETYGSAYHQAAQIIQNYHPLTQAVPFYLPVLCGESGYSTAWPGIDEATQGKYLARLFLFDVLSGVPLTIWYDWHDDGADPKEQEHNFGIVRNAYTPGSPQVYQPKLAYLAAQTYSHQLAGFRFKERLKTDSPDDYILSFTNPTNSSQCLAAWTASSIPHQIKISVPAGTYTSTSYDGITTVNGSPYLVATSDGKTKTASKGLLTLQLTGAPQYLKLK